MLESRYEATIAKPTASDSGTNRFCAAPCMKKAGMNTARMQSIASSRGTAVSRRRVVRSTRERLRRAPSCVWMFSISTVASSTRMPTASASPPSVIRLIVCPDTHSATIAARSANGMFSTTTSALRQSRRNSSTISPVSTAPSSPSSVRPADRARDVGRLVELEADLDVRRQHGLELRQVLLDEVDDGERRGVGPLGDQDVDGRRPLTSA